MSDHFGSGESRPGIPSASSPLRSASTSEPSNAGSTDNGLPDQPSSNASNGSSPPDVDRRARALAHIVGQARAYTAQVEEQAEELRQASHPGDRLLLAVLDAARAVTGAVDTLATEFLRAAD